MKKIFIACAHMAEAPLENLLDELRSIEDILQPLQERGIVEMILNRAAIKEDIFQRFLTDEIHIFHYCGHADEEHLYLEEESNIKGLASLFGLQKNPNESTNHNPLKFVFLNGCSSKGQVSQLHDAGIGAVIATSRPIGDKVAVELAKQFYRTWIMEGKGLRESFEAAKSFIHTMDEEKDRKFEFKSSKIGAENFKEKLPWGLYIHPELGEQLNIENWHLNEEPALPGMILKKLKPKPGQSLRELVGDFERSDPQVEELIYSSGKDPLMILIEKLPWLLGTHLRRLFAVEEDKEKSSVGIERLKELIVAYNELTRFICYLSLSMIWDAKEEGFDIENFQFALFPSKSDIPKTDYVYRTKIYYKILGSIENDDSLELEPHIENYLDAIQDPEQLKAGYQKMEEWKARFLENKENFEDFIKSLKKDEAWLEEMVLKFETLYASFLGKCLFLTKYKLITVRSIVFNKLRYLEEKTPFAHQTMSLHAAFGDLKTSQIGRDKPTDNYCLLLTQGDGHDEIQNVLNLSPFYIDRSSFIGKGEDNYPTLFALDYVEGKSKDRKYYYKYVDIDVNHTYRFEEDNTFIIDINGAILPDHLEVDRAATLKFRQIHLQLKLLEVEVPHTDKKA